MGSVPSTRKPHGNANVWSDTDKVYVNAIKGGLDDNDWVDRLLKTIKKRKCVNQVSLTAHGCLLVTPHYGTTDRGKQQAIKDELEDWCARELKHRVARYRSITSRTPEYAVR